MRFPRILTLLTAVVVLVAVRPAAAAWTFTEVAASSGFVYQHGFTGIPIDIAQAQTWTISGGAAAADYDRDGDIDVYAVRGDVGANLLFQNDGNGNFTEVGAAAGVSGAPVAGSGPVFADIDGDGWPDLLVGGVDGSASVIYRNNGNGTFQNVTGTAGFTPFGAVFSMSLGDFDHDGDLDIAAVHWLFDLRVTLWQNDGAGVFTDITASSGLQVGQIYGFSPTFSDIDGDGWVDLLVGADFGTSRVFRNLTNGTFTETTTAMIDDENGMGAAAFDYDNDGDVDWLVTSIWDPNQTSEGNWGISGNRLYRNLGNGVFEDRTTAAGVREGYWGWGACAQDLDQDGHMDVFHTNGFGEGAAGEFVADPSRLFHAQGNGTFSETSAALGIVDTGQGRGVLCFDHDGDGDLDVFVANNGGAPTLYRNDDPTGNYLRVRLTSASGNTEGIGAVVRATIGAVTQMREIHAGTNFASASPAIAHFGTGAATTVDAIQVEWPDGQITTQMSVAVGQEIVILKETPAAVPGPGPWLLILLFASMGAGWIAWARAARN
ncbi:MAG: CRTAC1 family protein [Candidatus Binatia bacterium]|nr:CRTAC1 family protein [Candidatus Binatia bacterium]